MNKFALIALVGVVTAKEMGIFVTDEEEQML